MRLIGLDCQFPSGYDKEFFSNGIGCCIRIYLLLFSCRDAFMAVIPVMHKEVVKMYQWIQVVKY